MLMTAAFALEADVIHDSAVIEVMRRCRIVRLIEEGEFQRMLMLAFQAFQGESELSFLKYGTHSGAAAGRRREQDRQSFLLIIVLILFTVS
jgi:hypothetical protein